MNQKWFRTGHLNDIVKQEHRTWLIFPIIMGVLLLRYGWEWRNSWCSNGWKER